MQDKMIILYQKLRDITAAYMVYQERHTIEMIKEIIPQIQEFVLWFLEGNRFGIEQALYQDLSTNLVNVVNDILTALQEEDRVLLNDAVAYGLMEYLEMFLDAKQEELSHGTL